VQLLGLARHFRRCLLPLFGLLGRRARFFRHGRRGTVPSGLSGRCNSASSAEDAAQLLGHILVDRAGVSFFLRNAQLGELVQQFVSFHFQLAGQNVDSNLVHK
jgi:hypothetical protein